MHPTPIRTSRALLCSLALSLAACGNGNAESQPSTTAAAAGDPRVTTVAEGLAHPWGMAFLPDGSLLVTERPGRLRRIGADGALSEPITGVPAVHARGQGGLLDVQLSPTFTEDRRIFLSYAEPGDGGTAGTAVARAVLDGNALRDVEVIFRQQPKVSADVHFGSRLVFARDGRLFVTMGDRGQRAEAQDTGNHLGTIVRIEADGRVPADNPLRDVDGARPEIWSFGHRNVQGAAINPWTGELWSIEHGPRGGDELNRPQPGANFGWPRATHGINYSGLPIPEAEGRTLPGTQDPWHVWVPSPGISGMAFHDDARQPAWQHSLFIGALAQRALIRLTLDGERVVGEQRLLESLGSRIRDVEVGPNGAVYVLTDETDGKLLKLEPATP